MREIVLDTETTGLDVNNGDKIVEIQAIFSDDAFNKEFALYLETNKE